MTDDNGTKVQMGVATASAGGGDVDRVSEFVKNWGYGEIWLIALQGGYATAMRAKGRQALQGFLDKHSADNIYFMVNPVRKDFSAGTKRPGKEHITAVHWIHVDIDCDKSKPYEEEIARIKARVDALSEPASPFAEPHVVIFSGGGYHLYWRLAAPVSVEAGEDLNRMVAKIVGGDMQSHDASRMMRLPYTMNYPDSKKAATGRVPAKAEVVWADWTARISHAGAAVAAMPLDLQGVAGTNGNADGLYPSRSEGQFGFVIRALSEGIPHSALAALLKSTDYPISAHCTDIYANKGEKAGDREVKRTIERAQAQVDAKGAEAAAAEHNPAASPSMGGAPVTAAVEEFNKRHAFIKNYGKKHMVMEQKENGDIVIMQDHTLHAWYSNDFIGKETKSKVWMKHKNRRSYDRLIFDPALPPGDNHIGGDLVFNRWRGFAYEPEQGDKHLSFVAHLRDNVCGGSEAQFLYLWRWMAAVVQKPHKPARSAIVLAGAPGTGKTFIGSKFRKLLAPHSTVARKKDDLVGRFNAHLEEAVFLLAEEAFFAGDRSNEGVLKDLITSETLSIEHKFVSKFETPNRLHIMMASNEDFVVRVGVGDRRFAVYRMSEKHRLDTDYFDRIDDDLDDGGYENLLHALLAEDLSEYKTHDIPMTTARREQANRTLSTEASWWQDVIQRKQLYNPLDIMGVSNDNVGTQESLVENPWPAGERVDMYKLHQNYIETCSKLRRAHLLGYTDWLVVFMKFGAQDEQGRLKDWGAAAGAFELYKAGDK